MNDHEAERIACAMHALRPDWPTASLLTLIRKQLIDRPRRDVTVALAWVACDSTSHTPARVLEAGPWWQAAAIEDTSSRTVARKFDVATCCGICSLPEADCRARTASDHDYEPAAQRRAAAETVDVAAAVAAAKSKLTTAPAPEPPPTFAALESRRPGLVERVAAGERVHARAAAELASEGGSE